MKKILRTVMILTTALILTGCFAQQKVEYESTNSTTVTTSSLVKTETSTNSVTEFVEEDPITETAEKNDTVELETTESLEKPSIEEPEPVEEILTEGSEIEKMDDPTDEELAKLGILTEFSTYYSLEEEFAGKAYNISLACDEIEVVIKSGEKFDWHEIVGNTNQAEGYVLANVYSGGKVVKGYGGGVCQVSSTMYNCVLNLEMEVIERHPHGLPVYYVDYYAGKDASVDDIGGFNFVFKNNLEVPIYIDTELSTEMVDGQENGKLKVIFYDATPLVES